MRTFAFSERDPSRLAPATRTMGRSPPPGAVLQHHAAALEVQRHLALDALQRVVHRLGVVADV